MYRKIVLLCLIILLTFSVYGCQLAREDGLNVEKDRLVGVYVTKEHLDLFDFESYISDNINTIGRGGEISVADSEKYGGRKYAELKRKYLINEETGQETSNWEYVFEGIDGIRFFYVQVEQPDGESYFSSYSDGAISDGHVYVGNDTSLEGTIYTSPRGPNAFYLNPVYQSSDGKVYLTAGSGISFSGDKSEGAVFSTTLEEKHAVTENGETVEESFKIKINIAVKAPPANICIIQMNSENMPVSQIDYKPNTLPDQVLISPEAEYVIVETLAASPGGEVLNREILNPDSAYFTSYVTRDDGICEARSVNLQWE
jgi:hypothetical protein